VFFFPVNEPQYSRVVHWACLCLLIVLFGWLLKFAVERPALDSVWLNAPLARSTDLQFWTSGFV
jgi:hypothetical protein